MGYQETTGVSCWCPLCVCVCASVCVCLGYVFSFVTGQTCKPASGSCVPQPVTAPFILHSRLFMNMLKNTGNSSYHLALWKLTFSLILFLMDLIFLSIFLMIEIVRISKIFNLRPCLQKTLESPGRLYLFSLLHPDLFVLFIKVIQPFHSNPTFSVTSQKTMKRFDWGYKKIITGP